MILKKQRRTGLIILCFLAACFLLEWAPGFAVPKALAEEDDRNQLEISITAKPAEMVAPGDVMLGFNIENISDVAAQNVYLSSADGLLSEPVGQLEAGETQSFNRQHSVTQEELDEGKVSYIISHDDPFDPNGKVNYTVHAEIRRSDVMPQAEFTRRFSSLQTGENGALTITYHIRNSGNVVLNNLRVRDSLGDYTGRVDRLDVGESRTLISRAVIDEESTSEAILDYYAEGIEDTMFTQALSPQDITIASTGMETQLQAAYSAFSAGDVDVLLTIKNTGETDIRNVQVSDESYGGVIADNLTVPAGESLEISHGYALRGDMAFTWKISGVSDSGETVLQHARTQGISALRGTQQMLTLSVSTDTPRIRRSGNVTIQISVSNPGGADISDVVLQEAALGEIYRFAVAPAKDFVQRTLCFDVKQDSAYDFSISYMDETGEQQRIHAAPLEITIAPDGVLPEGAKSSFIEFTGQGIKIGGSSIFAALLISGLVVLLVLIVLLLIASRRARIEKQMRIAAEKQRRREELGKTNRFTPVRAPKNKTKGR